MANFDTIKTAIDANIKTNGTQDITGGKMNSILKQMVDATDEQLTKLESEVNGDKKVYSGTQGSTAAFWFEIAFDAATTRFYEKDNYKPAPSSPRLEDDVPF